MVPEQGLKHCFGDRLAQAAFPQTVQTSGIAVFFVCSLRSTNLFLFSQSLRNLYFSPDQNLHWRYVSTVTRPKVVHVRANPVETKTNLFAQITVRIHSKQVRRQKLTNNFMGTGGRLLGF